MARAGNSAVCRFRLRGPSRNFDRSPRRPSARSRVIARCPQSPSAAPVRNTNLRPAAIRAWRDCSPRFVRSRGDSHRARCRCAAEVDRAASAPTPSNPSSRNIGSGLILCLWPNSVMRRSHAIINKTPMPDACDIRHRLATPMSAHRRDDSHSSTPALSCPSVVADGRFVAWRTLCVFFALHQRASAVSHRADAQHVVVRDFGLLYLA